LERLLSLKKIITTISFLMVLLPVTQAAETVKAFADEQAAVAFLSSFSGEEGQKLLASIRFKHAAKIYKLSRNSELSATQQHRYKNLALDYVMSAYSLDPNNDKIQTLAAAMLVKRGDSASLVSAQNLYETLYSNNKSTTNLLLLAAVYQMRELFYKAIPLYESLFIKDAEFFNNDVILLLNQSYLLDAQFERGIRFFSQITTRMPWLDSAILAKVILQKTAGNNADALITLQNLAKQRMPNTPIRKYIDEQIIILQALAFEPETSVQKATQGAADE
jgi:tetratricopeptide (TPR) repeat protein